MKISLRLILPLLLILSVCTAVAYASPLSGIVSRFAEFFKGGENSAEIDCENEMTDNTSSDSRPLIALTFDDGPGVDSTNRILDILEENDAGATFFVIGRNIQRNPGAIKRAYSIGCEIGNHTFDHKNLTRLTKKGVSEQISKTNDAVFEQISVCPNLIRAPAGHCNNAVKGVCDMPIIMWSIDTDDWQYGSRSGGNTFANRRRIERAVLDNAHDGDIVLMHDVYEVTADSCEVIIPELIKMGFELVTVSELFDAKGVKPGNGEIYRRIQSQQAQTASDDEVTVAVE